MSEANPTDWLNDPGVLLVDILNTSQNGIMVFRSVRDKKQGQINDFEFIIVNNTAERILGQPAATLAGRLMTAYFPKENKALFSKMVEVVEQGRPLIWEDQVQQENSMRHYRVTASRFKDGVLASFYDITQQKQAEDHLRKLNTELKGIVAERTRELELSRQQLNLVLNTVPVLISYVDSGYRYQYMNQAYESWFELRAEESKGKSLAEVLGEEAFLKIKPYADQALTGKPVGYETFIPYKTGGRHISAKYVPDKDEHGQVRGMFVLVDDISRFVYSQKEIQESAERFRTLIEAIPNMAWTALPNGLVNFTNRAWYDFTGIENMRDKDWEKVVPPDDLMRINERWTHSLQTGEPYEIEARMIRKDGEMRWVLGRATPVRNSQGEITLWIGTNTDIHDQKMAAAAIAEKANQFFTLAETLPALIWMAMPDGKDIYHNKEWENYTGVPSENGLGDGWHTIIHPEDLPECLQRYSESLLTGKRYEILYRLRRSDGVYRWFLARALPVKDSSGAISYWVGASTDTDEQKRYSDELERKNRELNRINADLDTVLYTASHDLRAPVVNIEGLVEVLKEVASEDLKHNPDFSSVTELLQQSVDKFGQAILELNNTSQIQQSLADDVEEVNIEELIEDVRLGLWKEVASSRAIFRVDTIICPIIRFSRKNLRSILFNLLSNAIKYRSLERPPLIKINSSCSDGEVILSVKDNGLGIPAHDYEQIFSIFKRLHHHVEGTGVGLYIVRRIVENAGGRIEVDSEIDRGSVFRIYLPQVGSRKSEVGI